jgi:hypothetical protein
VWAALWGFAFGACWMTTNTVLQTLAPGAMLGRAVARDAAAQALAQCAGGVLAIGVVGVAGVSPIVGTAGVVAGALAWALWSWGQP